VSFAPLSATVAQRTAAGIEIAFDPQAAGRLVSSVPAGIDFARQGLLCLFLGERATGGWSVAIQGLRVVGGQLEIAARETSPRGTGTGPATYPGSCVLVTRADLPSGELPATATDLATDEFIVDGQLAIPDMTSAL